jgi:hypothetical protein
MSGRYVTRVLESSLTPLAMKLTAAALASFADDVDGRRVQPSMDYVAWLTGLTTRAVQVHVKELRRMQVLIEVNPATQWRPTHYQMRLEALPTRAPFRPLSGQQSFAADLVGGPGVKLGAPQPGVKLSPDLSPPGVHPASPDPSVQRSVSTHTYRAREGDAPGVHGGSPLTSEPELPLVRVVRDSDHTAHAWCGRICVPKFLHRQFKKAFGGSVKHRPARMRAFYAETLAAIPTATPIAEEPVRFWRAAFLRRFSVNAPARSITRRGDIRGSVCPHEPRCDTYRTCIDRTIADGRAARERKSG